LVAATTSPATSIPIAKPIAMAAIAPATTSSSERTRLARSPSTVASIVPWMGPSSGATIIAPITAAVESATTPAEAMTDESTSSSQKRESRAPRIRTVDEDRLPHLLRCREARFHGLNLDPQCSL
jgi:hypothetical protein